MSISRRRLPGGAERGVVALLACVVAAPLSAEAGEPRDPDVRPTLPWLGAQLVPSPTLATGADGLRGGLAWQVTPLLYSWGIHRGLWPLRSLVVEPYARQSGSLELHLSPEIHFGEPAIVLLRPGGRAYFPLIEHGEYLTASLGVSYQRAREVESAAFDAGIQVLYGIVGVRVTTAPAPRSPLAAIAAVSLRYF